MYYSITSSCIREIHHNVIPSTFSGSTRFVANSVESVTHKPKKKSETRHVTPISALSLSGDGTIVSTAQPRSDREYKLNAPKIRRKITAFFNLKATRDFCAFYSISFPQGISDDDAYRIFNIWQTRCRQTYSLSSFLWVAERQKNGTIHFHLLTNTRMPVKEVNGFARTALIPYSHLYNWDVEKVSRYNGVDVDNVWYPKRRTPSQSSQRRTRDDAERNRKGKHQRNS